jgi:hypothetical protein
MNKMLDFKEFSPSGQDDWKILVQKELKQQSFEFLLWKDENDTLIEPYLSDYATRFEIPERNTGFWKISQVVDGSNPPELNKAILHALTGGAQAICLAYTFNSKKEIEVALQDVLMDIIAIQYQVNSARY